MFERFTERARRIIFFARYEASQFGSGYIEPEHLLLGALREDTVLRLALASGVQQIRREVESSIPRAEPVSTSIDMPLSADAKRALAYAAEEAEALQDKHIDTGHLVLGLLRLETSNAAALLRNNGIDLASFRKVLRRTPGEPIRASGRLTPEPDIAAPLGPALARLAGLIQTMSENVEPYSDTYGERHLKRKPWSRKQAIGNLIDWATALQNWLARALTEPKLTVPEYPQEEWVPAQNYEQFAFSDLVQLWIGLNRLLVHVLAQVPHENMAMPCHVGIEPPIALNELVIRYLEHCEDISGQILAHL